MSNRLNGKVAIITGASRGIGLAVAQRLVSEGAKVVITARKQEALDAAVAELGGPDVALAVAGRADDAAHQDEAIRAAIDTFGSLDVLVNNTGINPAFGPLLDVDVEVSRKIFEVNVIAALEWVKKAYAASMKERGGSIVNVASIAGLRPAPGIAMYGVSKAAVIHLTEELAMELGPTVRVNAVAPAVVKTRFAEALYEGKEEEVSEPYPLKRLGEPEDIGAAVAYLASDDAAWTTGQTLVVDGGITLRGGV
ncbi:NAD(P)-dependent dehydrogenase (short-subunit alcohol dehydrogenase family) [Barrientosiimonas humi]|uniref:NAD(P)-dependent dehydrogenase (Short-subunit alcohol dehydrogenase family) n=1 Tax=Barrientosiimonas humi TaxID=999931 RepID=A0A542X8J8_9MICO|nr:SDR family oxidoreductase [Barrientosiimonas humi]TQL32161.1 NAD(P)-dependent dehydrogenase (short-subunit alcohol dehydrogenase family) [Barrientosiimonas humi]CAG7572149.1 3-oxoacyl-[acyl-carrier-protein] reductase FabG [Barrientosiimonas humi]